MDRFLNVIRLFHNITCFRKRFRHDRIEHNIGRCDRVSRTYHTEFKFISRKCKRRSSVPVFRIFHQIRKSTHTRLQLSAFQTMCRLPCTYKLIDHILELLSKENGNNCRRRFICPKPVIISRISRRFSEKFRVSVDRFQNTCQNKKELNILMRCLSRFEHIDAIVCYQRPVIMFSRSIHPCKRFLMEQTFHSVPACHPFQSLHHDLIMVYRNIRFCIDRSKLMLSRRSLVMLSFRRNAYLPKFFVYIFHKRCDSLSDRSEIVIVHLLTFRRHRAKQRPSCIDQVFSLKKLF